MLFSDLGLILFPLKSITGLPSPSEKVGSGFNFQRLKYIISRVWMDFTTYFCLTQESCKRSEYSNAELWCWDTTLGESWRLFYFCTLVCVSAAAAESAENKIAAGNSGYTDSYWADFLKNTARQPE